MRKAVVLGTGHYVPDKIVTNQDLAKMFDTSDEWIQKRTGIKKRRFINWENEPLSGSDLGERAARMAISDAGMTKDDIDCIVYATLSPDKFFPGNGVLVQEKLDIPAGVPAFDIRNQCSGFLYSLQVANALIRSGIYERILLIGAEIHSSGLDFSDRGRDVTVLFGDGGAAIVLGCGNTERGVLSVRLHADGRFSDALQISAPSSAEFPRCSIEQITSGDVFTRMNGPLVFQHAVKRLPEVITEVLNSQGVETKDLKLLIPHQANMRINQTVQKILGLKDEQVFHNIQEYGNTSACSIPLALDQAVKTNRIMPGDLVCLASFGSGFTWGAALLRW